MVKSMVLWNGICKFVKVVAGGGSAGVGRNTSNISGSELTGGLMGRDMVGASNGNAGGERGFKYPEAPLRRMLRCYVCGGIGHFVSLCPGRTLSMTSPNAPINYAVRMVLVGTRKRVTTGQGVRGWQALALHGYKERIDRLVLPPWVNVPKW